MLVALEKRAASSTQRATIVFIATFEGRRASINVGLQSGVSVAMAKLSIRFRLRLWGLALQPPPVFRTAEVQLPPLMERTRLLRP